MKVAAIVLAAGKSQRMGTNKLLMKLGTKRLLDLVLDVLEAIRINETIVVLGHRSWEIADAIKRRRDQVRVVINVDYEDGMVSSFKTGLLHVRRVDAVFLVLGDQIINSTVLDAMRKRMEETKNLIVCPTYAGKKGHPVLFSRELFPEILNLKKHETLRNVIHRHTASLSTVKGDALTVMDIDTPEDLAKVQEYLKEHALD